jgi:hypothetical protein
MTHSNNLLFWVLIFSSIRSIMQLKKDKVCSSEVLVCQPAGSLGVTIQTTNTN